MDVLLLILAVVLGAIFLVFGLRALIALIEGMVTLFLKVAWVGTIVAIVLVIGKVLL